MAKDILRMDTTKGIAFKISYRYSYIGGTDLTVSEPDPVLGWKLSLSQNIEFTNEYEKFSVIG